MPRSSETAAARASGADPVTRWPAQRTGPIEGHGVSGRMRAKSIRESLDLTRHAEDGSPRFGAGGKAAAHLRRTGQDLLDGARTRQQWHLARQAVHAHRIQAECYAKRANGLPCPQLTLIPNRKVPTRGSDPEHRSPATRSLP